MCIIIDANTSPHFKASTDEVRHIVAWIISGKGTLETGGHNLTEIKACPLRSLLLEFIRAGRVRFYNEQDVKALQDGLDQDNMKSDDPHILALALASGCRLLFSHDKNLHKDFTDRRFLNPRGKVYQSAADHAHLLKGLKKPKSPRR